MKEWKRNFPQQHHEFASHGRSGNALVHPGAFFAQVFFHTTRATNLTAILLLLLPISTGKSLSLSLSLFTHTYVPSSPICACVIARTYVCVCKGVAGLSHPHMSWGFFFTFSFFFCHSTPEFWSVRSLFFAVDNSSHIQEAEVGHDLLEISIKVKTHFFLFATRLLTASHKIIDLFLSHLLTWL